MLLMDAQSTYGLLRAVEHRASQILSPAWGQLGQLGITGKVGPEESYVIWGQKNYRGNNVPGNHRETISR